MISKHYIVKGRVQGVSFRFYTRQQAQALQINGWVRNKADGSVEVTATAHVHTLEKFEARLRVGPTQARVDTLTIEEIPLQEFDGFNITN
jgi:acylphosphatase